MNDDEFMKELLEATQKIEEESLKNKPNKTKEVKNTEKKINVEENLNDNLGELMKLFGNLNPEQLGFDEKDKLAYKEFHEQFMSQMKNDDLLKEINSPSGLGSLLNNLEGGNTSNDNPFTDTFKNMNNENFGGLGLDDEFGKLFESLSKLANLDENKEGGNFLEGALDSLISAQLLKGPLNEIKNEIVKFKNEKKDLSEEKIKGYNTMVENIDIILEEMEKTSPDKAKIIDYFSKLQENNDLDQELFSKIGPDMNMFGGFKK